VRFHHPPVASIWGGYTLFEDPDANAFMLVSVDPLTQELEAHQRARADREEAERRSAHERSIAMQVQSRLFPQQRPASATLDYAGLCVQARQVGGDYFDFLDFGDDLLGLLVGDISGKGIGAALLMANLQANVRSQSAGAPDRLVELLRSVNRLFHANTPDNAYATLFFAVYDGRCRRLRYVNCGHPPALLLRADGTLERLGATAGVIGLFEPWDCTMAECQLHEGDTLAIYSDGVTEALSETGEEFGDERLERALVASRDCSAQAGLDGVLAEVQKFSGSNQYDDITLIVCTVTSSLEERLFDV
jgi:phosphoserine phosphatase RsbU/P